MPIEAFYAYLVLRNGVPVAYGGTWHLFGTLWFVAVVALLVAGRPGARRPGYPFRAGQCQQL